VSADPFFTSKRVDIVSFAKNNTLPAAYPWREYVAVGGLMSYGSSLPWAYRQVGRYAGRLLRTALVRDLPLIAEPPPRLVINQQTASDLSLIIPDDLLLEAEVI